MSIIARSQKHSGWLCVCVTVLALWGALKPSAGVWAQTPFSQGRQCGMPGTSCPPPTPMEYPWLYDPNYNFYPIPAQWFTSVGAVVSWYQGVVEAGAGGWCSADFTGTTPVGTPTYNDNTEVGFSEFFNFSQAGAKNSSPPCGTHASGQETVGVSRSIHCPIGLSLAYQASPLIGPSCIPPAPPTPVALTIKQLGPACPAGCGGPQGTNQGAADAHSGVPPKGNPVNMAIANKYEVETDYVGPGSSPLRFVRTYNSYITYASVFRHYSPPEPASLMGLGWSATYFQFLMPATVTDSTGTYSSVYAFRPDGRMLIFSQYNSSTSVYSPDGDVADRLVKTSSGWQYQTGDDTIETYDTTGDLLSVAQRGQAPVTVSRPNPGDPPSSVSDAYGHTLQFRYTVNGNGFLGLSVITDPAGKTLQYAYDSSSDLTSVTYQDGTTRQYGYGSSPENELQTLTDESNVAFASWTYNSQGSQVLSSQHAGGVEAYTFTYSTNSNGVVTSATVLDPLGVSRTYGLQLNSGTNRVVSSSGACVGCGEDENRVLDADGNITSRTDFNGNVTTYVYDTLNNLETSRTEAYGTPQARTITTTWDPNWRQPDLVTEPNRTTAFSYDALGNVLTKTVTDTSVTPNVARTWTYTYDTYGRMLTADGPRTDVTDTTTYSYYTCAAGFQCGQVQTITDALGHITTFNTYDTHGKPLTITDPNGVVTTLTYDLRQRLTSRQIGSETTSYSYYPTGLLQTVTLPDSSTVTYTYDAAHRLTKITDSAGNYVSYTLDAMGNRTAENTYDPSSTLRRKHTRVINTLNELYQDINSAGTAAVTTTLAYDNNGNVTSSAAPLSRTTTNQYDALNRLKQITDPNAGITKLGYDANDNLASVIDPRNLTTTYTHDGFGEVTQLVSPDTGTSFSTYDSGGNLKATTDARGALATYSYDALNRVTQVAYSDQTINFTYDSGTNGVGRLTSAADANHSLSWTYDALGRVTGKGQTIGTVTKSVGYAFSNGDLNSLVTPSGQTVVYSYTNHRITSISVNGTTILSGVTYDPFGPANAWNWGNGTTASHTFDQDGNPSQFITAGVTNGYTVDNAFRITAISDSGLSSNSWTFGYDLLDRINSGLSSAITEGYTYDANSNRLTTTGTLPSAETVATSSNQLNSTSGGIVRTYSYDNAGNTLGFTGETFTFNQRGRMSSASSISGTTSYIYNALGQLIEKSGYGGTTLLMYDEAGHILGEYSSTGALIQETVWMGDTPVATLQPNGSSISIYYVHADHQGTPRKITRPSDNGLMWRWDPDTFGSLAPNTNPAGLGTFGYNLRFPGQYALTESGLYYNYFRTYDPQMGRYIESDPIGLAGRSVSTYTYVGDDPLDWSDPFGLVENSPANIARRMAINNLANSYDGSTAWAFGVAKDDFPAGSDKCNKFVCDVLRTAGAPISVKVNTKARCARAGELANKHWNPGDWRQLGPNEVPQPGDVAAYPLSGGGAAYSGHSGIITDDPTGSMSAHATSVYGVPGQFGLDIPGIVYRRYTGE
jgi:RHS repeat-associated protein